MKKFLLVAALALGLGGCQTTFGNISTSQVASAYSVYGVALAGAVAYRNRPLCKTGTVATVTNLCAQRSIIVKLQGYNLKASAALTSLRNFVTAYPTLDASNYVIAAQTAIADFDQFENANGVK